jgi:hypothetical protein
MEPQAEDMGEGGRVNAQHGHSRHYDGGPGVPQGTRAASVFEVRTMLRIIGHVLHNYEAKPHLL